MDINTNPGREAFVHTAGAGQEAVFPRAPSLLHPVRSDAAPKLAAHRINKVAQTRNPAGQTRIANV
jgi:hypothetical protein